MPGFLLGWSSETSRSEPSSSPSESSLVLSLSLSTPFSFLIPNAFPYPSSSSEEEEEEDEAVSDPGSDNSRSDTESPRRTSRARPSLCCLLRADVSSSSELSSSSSPVARDSGQTSPLDPGPRQARRSAVCAVKKRRKKFIKIF